MALDSLEADRLRQLSARGDCSSVPRCDSLMDGIHEILGCSHLMLNVEVVAYLFRSGDAHELVRVHEHPEEAATLRSDERRHISRVPYGSVYVHMANQFPTEALLTERRLSIDDREQGVRHQRALLLVGQVLSDLQCHVVPPLR